MKTYPITYHIAAMRLDYSGDRMFPYQIDYTFDVVCNNEDDYNNMLQSYDDPNRYEIY